MIRVLEIKNILPADGCSAIYIQPQKPYFSRRRVDYWIVCKAIALEVLLDYGYKSTYEKLLNFEPLDDEDNVVVDAHKSEAVYGATVEQLGDLGDLELCNSSSNYFGIIKDIDLKINDISLQCKKMLDLQKQAARKKKSRE